MSRKLARQKKKGVGEGQSIPGEEQRKCEGYVIGKSMWPTWGTETKPSMAEAQKRGIMAGDGAGDEDTKLCWAYENLFYL